MRLIIENHTLYADGAEVEPLPHLAIPTKVLVWGVPTSYRASGFFVSVRRHGLPQVVPACSSKQAQFLAELDLEPHPDAVFEAQKQALKGAATAKRWAVMTGGMTIPPGILVGTTIDDQNRITSVVANAELAGLTDADEVDFKASSGWVRITIAEVKAIAGAIGQFVQACYTAERTHHEAIEALETPEEIAAYDTGQGWPNQTETEPT